MSLVSRRPVVLLPSVLLGPVSVEPVAEALRGLGRDVRVADPGAPGSAAELLDRYRSALPDRRTAVLVSHSNAGLFTPALLAESTVRGAVFVDALLPAVAATGPPQDVPVVPPGLRSSIPVDADGAPLAWPFWWDPADLDGLCPSAAVRREIERRALRPAATLLSSAVHVPPLTGARGGYVAFGDTYRADRERAEALGWPTRRMVGGHLHLLVDPAGVARAIVEVAARAGLL